MSLLSAFKEASDRGVLFVIQPNPNHRYLLKLLQFICFFFYITDLTIIGINIATKDGGIVMMAVNSVFLLMTLMILSIILFLLGQKNEINDVISWFTEPTWKKFDISLLPHAANRFNYARAICSRMILLQIKLYDGICGVGSIGIAIIKQFFPAMRYELPIPYHLPVKDYKNWTVFGVGMVIQTVCVFCMAQAISFLVAFLFAFYLLVHEYLNIIIDEIEKLKSGLKNKSHSLLVLIKMVINCMK